MYADYCLYGESAFCARSQEDSPYTAATVGKTVERKTNEGCAAPKNKEVQIYENNETVTVYCAYRGYLHQRHQNDKINLWTKV